MQSRGMKQYAVMAMKDGWSKPRFVYMRVERWLLIFDRKMNAAAEAKRMNDDRCTFGPKNQSVTWLVVPV